jgi:hypothetical protein
MIATETTIVNDINAVDPKPNRSCRLNEYVGFRQVFRSRELIAAILTN